MPTFDASTLRILRPDGKIVGTGFLVTNNLAVTCAHVVVAAEAIDGDTIQVQFTGRGEKLEARVEPKYWRDTQKGDVAFLRLKTIPKDITPLRLGPAAQSLSGNPCYSFGYAAAADIQGVGARGNIVTLLPDASYLQIRTHEADHGISGAPVLDENRSVVVGMITKGHIELGRNAETTFVTPAEFLFEICPEIRPSETCPYLGLESFTAETAQFFFGREALTEKLLGVLRGGCHFLAVFGPSGSGKSSLVRAGLLPALKNGQLPGSQKWAQVTMRPADNPFAQMKSAGLESLDIPEYIQSHPGMERVILFIDQFEELFTLCPEHVREKFVDELATALENSHFMLILSMRNDFYSAFNAKAAPLAQSGYLKIENVPSALKHNELLAMIEQPAKAVGLAIEEGLAELILKDLTRDGEARSSTLPLLEFTLMQLWEKRRDGLLTHEVHQSIGGVTGSLARWAEDAYSDLPKTDQPLAESLLTSLVHPGDEAQGLPDTRKRRALAELGEPTQRVIKHFADRRLLVTGGETVELVHDALLREWGRLQDWLKQNRTQLQIIETVGEAASAWSAAPDNIDLLVHRGGRLEDALKLDSRLSVQEQAYLDACLELRESERRERDRRRKRNLTGVGIALAMLVAVLTGWGLTSNENARQLARQAATAEAARDLAQAQAKIARAGELASLSRLGLTQRQDISLLLSAEAFLTAPTRQVHGSLLSAVQASPNRFLWNAPGSVNGVAYSPDGTILATTSNGKTITLWNPSTGTLLGQLKDVHTGTIASIAFSPLSGGKLLASGGLDKKTVLWDVNTQKPIGFPLRHGGYVYDVAFSPDGKSLAVGGVGGIAIWDIETRKMVISPLRGHTANKIAFDPSGNKIAAINADKTLILWDIASGKPQVLSDQLAVTRSVAFSPDGKLLASSSDSGTIALWDTQSGLKLASLSGGHVGVVTSLVFHPAGNVLVSGSADGSLIFWDLLAKQKIENTLYPSVGGVADIAFSQDGNTLAVGGGDRSVSLWNLDTRKHYPQNQLISKNLNIQTGTPLCAAASPNGEWLAIGNNIGKISLLDRAGNIVSQFDTGQSNEVCSIAFHPNGKLLATGYRGNTVLLWDISARQALIPGLKGHTGPVLSVAFSPLDGGKILASGSADGTVILWDAKQGLPTSQPLQGQIGPIYSLAFSPNAKILAAGGEEALILWDVESQQPFGNAFTGYYDSVKSIAFSPDGKFLATGSDDFEVKIWDISETQSFGYCFPGHTYSVNSVAFSQDSKILASGGEDNLIILWDVSAMLNTGAASGQCIGPALNGFTGPVKTAIFSPNGQTLLSIGQENTITEWTVDMQALFGKACQIVGRNFTRAEWAQYFPGEAYRATCPQWPLEPEPTPVESHKVVPPF